MSAVGGLEGGEHSGDCHIWYTDIGAGQLSTTATPKACRTSTEDVENATCLGGPAALFPIGSGRGKLDPPPTAVNGLVSG
jgi:hypothetical protein